MSAVENDHPNPDTLQELRRRVARYGVASSLPDPVLAHCDDCHGYGACFGLQSGRVVCLAHWVARKRAAARLAAS